MQKEIERKFLLTDDWKEKIAKYVDCTKNSIRQGYMKLSDPVVRVRTFNNRGILTIKGNPEVGKLGVDEYEYDIPYDDASRMLSTLCDTEICKIRYRVGLSGKVWEIDEFLLENEGLAFCEIELKSENEAITLPSFVGKEVTEDFRYYNNYIINNPYNQWNI